jgi:ATP-dependent RNA helicase RhlE
VTNTSFIELGLAEPIVRALEAERYAAPTPIQTRAIPFLLAGKDLLGIAQTGTGKTAAFALPLLQTLSATRERARPGRVRALILGPTRELAIQIAEAFRTYGRHLQLRYAVVYGGVGQRPQVEALRRGVDVLIATPGRLLDLHGQGHLHFDALRHVVLDEADRMLDMGFIRDVRKIVAALPRRRQTIFLSATMPNAVAGLAAEMLSDPVRVAVTPTATPVAHVAQSVFFVAASDKRDLLIRVLRNPALASTIVFTRTKHGANRVAAQLGKAGVAAEAIHGNKSQGARQRALESFRTGRARVLVATDIAARGIDVDGVTHVINYELPNVPEDYVHRIGRTARAGASGAAISFCDPGEQPYLRDIETLTRRRLEVVGGTPASGKTKRPAPPRARQRRNNGGRRSRRAA